MRAQVAQVVRLDVTLAVGATTDGYARVPSEQLRLSRIFRLRERFRFQAPPEFVDVFNRIVRPTPAANNPLQMQTTNMAGVPTAGFGRIDATSVSGQRNGQIIPRVEW